MTETNHQLARAFFAALSKGVLPEEMFTSDMTAWTTTSGQLDKQTYLGGVGFLASIFSGGLAYSIDSLTAEGDRVAAEVQSRGTLINGVPFHNIYVFILRIRDGRIASVAEHFNPAVVGEKIMPLLQEAMAKAS